MEGACVRLCTSTAYPFHQISRRETDTAQHAMAICSLCEFCIARGVRSVLPAVVVALRCGTLGLSELDWPMGARKVGTNLWFLEGSRWLLPELQSEKG